MHYLINAKFVHLARSQKLNNKIKIFHVKLAGAASSLASQLAS